MKWLLVPLAAVLAFTAAYNVPAPAKDYVPLAIDMAPEVATTPKTDRLPLRVVYPPMVNATVKVDKVCLQFKDGKYLPCGTAYQDFATWVAAGQEV